jgi:hypothetical protein
VRSRHAYVVSEGVAQRGAVRRPTPFVRGIEAEDRGGAVSIQLFIAWLVLVPANRLA